MRVRECGRAVGAVLCGAVALAVGTPAVARAERLGLRHVVLDLPGPPSKVVPVDLDGDSRTDLVVVVAYSEVGRITEDRIEDMIQFTTVIPAVFDRREVRAYLATADGGYSLAGAPLPLPTSVLHLERAAGRLVALTDDGVAELRYEPRPGEPSLRLVPRISETPVLAGTRTFFASLRLVHDLDGDGVDDLLLPSENGLAVFLGTADGLEARPASRVPVPGSLVRSGDAVTRSVPLPDVSDVDGDGVADLVFSTGFGGGDSGRWDVLLGSTFGRFRPLRAEPLDCHDRGTDLRLAVDDPAKRPWPDDMVAFRDLDGDGRAEAVFADERPRGDSLRKELKDAKRPISEYRFHRLNPDLTIAREPYHSTEVVGHTMEDVDFEQEGIPLRVEQFQDLDGDGREDLVTVTLDFSVFQALKILATKRIGIGLDFHVWAQAADGTFSEVPGLDLSEKLKIDLNALEIGRFAQFAGDFDGDGRKDFAHFGRGRRVTIHTGRPGCRFPVDPDLAIELEEEPAGLDLVSVDDLDGDGRSDLRVTRPLPGTDPDATAPVRLDLYLSGEAP